MKREGENRFDSFEMGENFLARIAEYKVHPDCARYWSKKYGEEAIILGRVLSASIDQKGVEGTLEQSYK